MMRIPDHDLLIQTVQSRVQEAMDKRRRDVLEEAARRHYVSYALLYRITKWRPSCRGESFNLRKLLDAYECACDVLGQAA
jgi:hypothetical protein